ncbi:MAG: HEAT repeat domain-containing protein, partial [Candidatus Electrothrix sp. AR5]|nr:HEAT repeat domain-containing protein [Candidatus Electrothrix sp. AR5]
MKTSKQKKLRSEVQSVLSQGLSELEAKLYQDLLLEMGTACAVGLEKSWDWLEDAFRQTGLTLTAENTELLLTLAELLIARSLDLVKAINILEETRNTFSNRYETASSEQEQRKHILNFAQQLGASPAQLRKDQRAFKRWFDFDAVLERCSSQIKDTEYRLAFHLNRIAAVPVTALAAGKGPEDEKRVWRRLSLGSFFEQMIRYPGDPRVKKAAFLSLTSTVRPLSKSVRETMTGNHIISSIYRSAMDPQQDIWIQCEALALLAQISFFSCLEALTVRLSEARAGDDFFVRARAVRIAEGLLPSPVIIDSILSLTEHDPSPFVRQAGVQALATAMIKERTSQTRKNLLRLLHQFIRQDESPQVRSAGILTLQRFFQANQKNQPRDDHSLFATASALCKEILEQEQESFVLRTLLHALGQTSFTLALAGDFGMTKNIFVDLAPLLSDLHQQHKALSVRRWAAQCREKLFIYANKERFALHQEIAQQLQGLGLGKTRRLPRSLIPKSNPNTP